MGNRSHSRPDDQPRRVIEQLVFFELGGPGVLARGENRGVLLGFAHLPPERNESPHLCFGDHRTVKPLEPRGARRKKKHVPSAQELLSIVRVQNRARVDA